MSDVPSPSGITVMNAMSAEQRAQRAMTTLPIVIVVSAIIMYAIASKGTDSGALNGIATGLLAFMVLGYVLATLGASHPKGLEAGQSTRMEIAQKLRRLKHAKEYGLHKAVQKKVNEVQGASQKAYDSLIESYENGKLLDLSSYELEFPNLL